jgi:DNA-binding MarR family transcriptional regulator
MNIGSTTPTDAASRVWIALHNFVAVQDRRRALRAALDLGPGKVEALIALLDGPMNLREIARALEIDPPAATVGVDQLEMRGLVHRTPHPDDKRRKLVHLTDAGRETAQRGRAILNEPPSELIDMDPEDLAQFDTLLARLVGDSDFRTRQS